MGPGGGAVSPDGRYIYVAATNGDSVVIFYRDNDSFVGYEDTVTDAANLDGAQNLAVSPDGTNLYVTSFTNTTNGRGTCAACNYAKQAPGWQITTHPNQKRPPTMVIITPTGTNYRATPPPLPGNWDISEIEANISIDILKYKKAS